ncbi:DUF2344 domain-containing protein [Caloramator sp. mosi_1]|uniref:DUF2344 domain-containing protein n=1 Tax=Caloramator sp. mosi_1 TaxID=3023090 RepID=UPI00235DD8C2|nr:DUF2344 domain-containing protein [Caloramator sp. mosi_1]WDC83873.1 DUF2344 domain-containing protein [Caloramator sp. mosi_1]
MAATYASKYEIKINYTDKEKIEEAINYILNSKEILKIKKTKSGEKTVNIRDMIFDLNTKDIQENYIILECVVLTSNSGSLSPDVIVDILKESDSVGVAVIKRTEMYTKINDKLIPLDEFFGRM